MHFHTSRQLIVSLNELPEEILLHLFGFIDGFTLVSISSVNSKCYRISQEQQLWTRLCAQGTYNFSYMDHLIINYIPGIWGRVFHAHTTRTWAELTHLAEYKQIDLHTLYHRLWAAQHNRCGVCLQQASMWHLNHLLIKICSTCCNDKSKFITKTEAKKNFFLSTDKEFDSVFCIISHNRSYYLTDDVKRQALCKYGGEDAFKQRHRKFSERSRKIKLGKEMTRVRRKHLSYTDIENRVLTTGPFVKGSPISEERVKLALMVLGYVQSTPAAVSDLMLWFNNQISTSTL